MLNTYIMEPAFRPLGTPASNEDALANLTGSVAPELALGYMQAAGSSMRHLDYEPIPIAQTAAQSVRDVLNQNGMELRELDGLIYAGLFRENLEPSTAAFTALELGAPRLKTLDVTTACSGMAHAVEVAVGWLAANPSINNVALVSVETPFRAIDWEINSGEELETKGSGLTLGAAASALIITRERPALGIQLRAFVGYDDASYAPICKLPIGGLFTSDSNRLAKPTIHSLLKVKATGVAHNTWVLPHQPSIHVSRIARILETDSERVIITHPLYGNTAASAWVSAYHHLFTNRLDEVVGEDPVLVKTMAGGFSSLGILGSFIKNGAA